MNESAVQRLTANHALLAARMPQLTRSFYAHLFELAPQVRPLFRIDIDIQSQHLAASLALIVRNLRLMDVLEEPLMELGAGHAKVGVRPEHYPIVSRTMVQTLREGSGDAWSAELEADWTAVFDRVCRIMMQGAVRQAST